MQNSSPKFDLDALLHKVRTDISKPKALKGKATREKERRKTLRIGEFDPQLTRKPTLRELMAAIEAARQWEPKAVVLLVQHQTCACGETHRCVSGLFMRFQSRSTGASKLAPTNGEAGIDLFPREIQRHYLDVPACEVCFKAQDLVDMVFNGIKEPANGQLPLFVSLL